MNNPYLDMQSGPIKDGFIDIGPKPVILRYRSYEWFMEFHPWVGPVVLSKRTQDPLAKQPKGSSPFWRVAKLWKEQGGQVDEYGVAIWIDPTQ